MLKFETKITLIAICLLFFSPKLPIKKEPSLQKTNPKSVPHQLFKNWGLFNYEDDSHVDAIKAWTIEEGSSNVIVAVLDTGVDVLHPDLAKNIWHDPNEKNKLNGPIFGWNFINNHPNPIDDNGHGTHISGIIGAISDSKTGISGVTHSVSIMPVKYYADQNPGSISIRNTVQGIYYAVKHGANIINYSGGGNSGSEEEYQAIRYAEAKGVLFVTSAGNEQKDTDLETNQVYPTAYGLSNIISVAATDIHNNLLLCSNWGKKHVDVTAPGENIYSTLPGGRYGYMSGTSQAAAFVSGIAALLISHNPKLTPQQIKSIILGSVDVFPELKDKVLTGGRVNAYSALIHSLKLGENP